VATNGSDIDNALVARLGSDPTLLGLCPNGVYLDEAPAKMERFVIVRIVEALDVDVFGARAYEEVLYAIEARMLETAGGDGNAAAARIDALLQDAPLTVAGYVWMTTYRETRTRWTERDAVNPTIRWHRRGGTYRVQMAPAAPAARPALVGSRG
jgi:hypothetical protein